MYYPYQSICELSDLIRNLGDLKEEYTREFSLTESMFYDNRFLEEAKKGFVTWKFLTETPLIGNSPESFKKEIDLLGLGGNFIKFYTEKKGNLCNKGILGKGNGNGHKRYLVQSPRLKKTLTQYVLTPSQP